VGRLVEPQSAGCSARQAEADVRTRPRAWPASALLVVSTVLGGCETGPVAAFETNAAPVIERSCALTSCHGVPPGEPLPAEGYLVEVDASGRLADLAAARARSLERVVTRSPFHLSSLVRVPLSAAHRGGPHVAGDLFASPADPQAASLGRWIDAELDGSGGEDLVLTDLEVRFAADVLPVLFRRCGFAGCHGPTDHAQAALSARPDPTTGVFAPLDIRSTHRVARSFLELTGGDVTRSRLIRKALGETASGLRHRGGSGTLLPGAPVGAPLEAPEVQAILGWARAERAALGVVEGRAPRGVVFVRGPVAERRPFRIDPGPVGSDVMLAPWPPGSGLAENLTASLHPEGPAELREPAVAHDGRTVAFAMRRASERAFALWELDLESRAARRLTREGERGSFVSPVFGPDGRLVAVSDGFGDAAAGGVSPPPELVAVDADGSVERLTWTPAPEVRPAVLASGRTRGMIALATRRAGADGPEGVLFRFPLCHDPELHGEPEVHVHFGATLAPAAPLFARDLLDGRQILVVLPSVDAPDDRGALVVLDRSLGPRLVEGAPPSIPRVLDPLSTLDDGASWRDPIALPDGRILASSDRDRARGEDALVFLTLEDGPEGAALAARETWLAAPGVSLRDAALVAPRPVEDDAHRPLAGPDREDAHLAIRDAAVLEAIYGRPEPTGARPLRGDLAAVRLIVPARTEGLLDAPGGRLLAELPLAADGSAEIRIPARTAIALAWLDARGMVVGRQLDRWFYAQGGEVVPLGTNPATYPRACSSCHGSLDGAPEVPVGDAPDVLSAASVTLASHEERDRRRPLAPIDVSTAPRTATTWDVAVASIVERRCAPCHGGGAPAAGLSLERRPGARFDAGYEALVGRFVDPGLRARASALVERLVGEELDAPGEPSGRCPPEGLSADELARVVRWIETGAAFREVADAP
jgi:hypothetical protein